MTRTFEQQTIIDLENCLLAERNTLEAVREDRDELRAKLAAMESELSSLPAKWSEDSSLETWFPYTNDELVRLREENSKLRAYKEAAENRSMAWLANALEQYTNGDVITVPAGAGTEEEFFAWLKDQGSAGTVPEDISALIEKVRKWGVEHTGNEPSVSCFHRALDDLKAAIARPLPAAKPARITEQDARVLIESAMHHYIFNDRSTNIDVWFKEKGKVLLDKLNADRQGTAEQVPDAIQLLQRVAARTTDKPASDNGTGSVLWSDTHSEDEILEAHSDNVLFDVVANLWEDIRCLREDKPADKPTVSRGTNRYGLDIGYLSEKLGLLLRDIDSHKPDEAARVLARLAKVADEKVLLEPEFSDKPAVAVPDFETWWRSLPSYRDADKPAAKMAWDYLARLVTSPSHSQQSAVVVPDGFREIVESVAHIGVDFGYGNFALSQEHIEKARALLEAAPPHSQQSTDVTISCSDKKSITAEQYRTLVILARRAMHIAYVWNDHNFQHAHILARETAKSLDIHNRNEANDFLAGLPIRHIEERPLPTHESEQGGEK